MQEIKEEDGLQKEWYAEAREMTMEKLPAFLEKITTQYKHDYGTICHAISSAAIAAAWAVEHTPQGGITGFQAGCIMWEFITHWMTEYADKPIRLVSYEKMLYPQYNNEFTTITKDTWEWLQKEATRKLAESPDAHPNVVHQWKTIVNGQVPFDFKIAA
jgi:hypothetical protein